MTGAEVALATYVSLGILAFIQVVLFYERHVIAFLRWLVRSFR